MSDTTLDKVLKQYILDTQNVEATSIGVIEFEVTVDTYGGCNSCGDIEKSATLEICYATEDSRFNYIQIEDHDLDDFLGALVDTTLTLQNKALKENNDG